MKNKLVIGLMALVLASGCAKPIVRSNANKTKDICMNLLVDAKNMAIQKEDYRMLDKLGGDKWCMDHNKYWEEIDMLEDYLKTEYFDN